MAVYQYLEALDRGVLIATLLLSIPLVFLSYRIHESAHWLAGRAFGASSELTYFPLRGKSKVWMLSTMAMRFDDHSIQSLSRAQIRLIAMAGPTWDLLFGVVCVSFYNQLPGPELLRATTACGGGMVLLSTIALNIVPLPFGNDGWRVLHPTVSSRVDK